MKMVQGLTDVENTTFGGNTFIQSAQLIAIANSIALGMCLNGRVWQNAPDLSLIMRISHWISLMW